MAENAGSNVVAFEGKLKAAGLIKDAIAAVYEIVKEDVSFKLTKDGLFLSAMDPANVSMVIFKLLVPAFETYSLKEETVIGVDMERLMQVLKQASPMDSLTLKLEEGAANLSLVFRGTSTRRFQIPLVNNPSEGRKPPTITFEVTAVLKSDVLAQGVSDAEVFSDSVVFLADKGKFSMETAGEMGRSALELEKGVDAALIELTVDAPAKSRYAVDYLKKMLKGAKLAENVRIQFKSDFPIQVEYSITDTLQIKFVLAPRIESD
jgi:proliferating cell nuclear antigen